VNPDAPSGGLSASVAPPAFDLADAICAGGAARSLAEFRRGAFYKRNGPALEKWIGQIRGGGPSIAPVAGGAERVRLVHWNIEQGKRWDRIVAAALGDPQLRDADLWTLNEVDVGTARAGNRDVARELADALGLYWVYVANFFEFTKGPGADADAPGENAVGLHGIALLSRWPLDRPGAADLPDCFDYFRLPEEKRYGARRVLWATVRHPQGEFTLATAHFEVRNTPARRATQMAGTLASLPEGPCLLAGDWNTHTFRRGSFARSAAEFLRLQRTAREELDRQLVEPWDREPSLPMAERAGFDFRRWNDSVPTARQVLAGVEEMGNLPRAARRAIQTLFRLEARTLRMRLDWIAVRGPWTAAPGGSGCWTRPDMGPEGSLASDHAPIGIDAVWGDPRGAVGAGNRHG
jgi:endonuclease/exonuclease/phosphatase family metal-dependent hydrolase